MSRIVSNQSIIPVAGGQYGLLSTYCDPLIASPCRCRPNTGKPCPLPNMSHDNDLCYNCGHIPGKGKTIYSDEEILDKMMEPDFYKTRQGEYDHRQGRKKLCAWPSNGEPCKNISNRNCLNGFCNRHNMIYKNRVKAGWDKKDLFAPVALRKGKN